MRNLTVAIMLALSACVATQPEPDDLGITCAADLEPEYCERVKQMHREWVAGLEGENG
jgi:hypothetical protein